MRRLKIAIDVDDVLAENAAGFVAFSNQRWGTALQVDDYDEHWAKIWNVDNEEVERRAKEFHDSSLMRGYGHIGGAYEALQALSADHHLVIATSRRLQMKADTLAWIEEHFPGIFASDTVHFAGIWDTVDDHSIAMTKADLVAQINADVLVDDQVKHCIAVAETGRQALLFGDYSWNQQASLPSGVTRCLSWSDVQNEIGRIASS